MTRHERAASTRQDVIDYIIAHPGVTAPEIIAALGWPNRAVGADRLAEMSSRGELSREKVTIALINPRGIRYTVTTYAYTALVTKTKSAATVVGELAANLGLSLAAKQPAPKAVPESSEPWRTVHVGGNRRDLVNQRGQGAIPPSARRGCSLGGF